MSKFIKTASRASFPLVDPRSTGAPPRPRLSDILGLKGTKPS